MGLHEVQYVLILINVLALLFYLIIYSSSSNRSRFQKLEKFSGQNNDHLSSWSCGFDSCCVVTSKSDDKVVKEQLLIVSESLEEEEEAA